MLSYYRVRTFLRWVTEMLDEIERTEGKDQALWRIKMLCIQFDLNLAKEAEEERKNAKYSREWQYPRR